ncbi:conserved hypothetical protein [Methanosalsum zhilinae DSM 4017]|uniref:Uncharacterized protein n=1 Tax=Methanosalsum zhilinae (strain DSM 4017 / NBRC 107636 / OCM 62 / WeN5) TaxID=679901 RepID=F7XP56_METZD|nr:conserved hypothetical protein [Methanosalsum zhilinae DSM 4017]
MFVVLYKTNVFFLAFYYRFGCQIHINQEQDNEEIEIYFNIRIIKEKIKFERPVF